MTCSPGAAVVAATALSGTGTATVASATTGERVGVVHARTAAGAVVLLATDEAASRLGLGPGGDGDDVAVELEVVVEAALPDLTVPRAQLVVQGWLAPVADAGTAGALEATCALGDLAELHAQWPDARLLDLDVAAARLHWPEGCTDVPPGDLEAASPDPVTLREAHVLARVEAELGDRLVALVRSMGHAHPAPGGAGPAAPAVGRDLGRVGEVRCVGADRYGLVLRCRTEHPWQVLGRPGCTGPAQDGPAQDGPAQDGPAQEGPAHDAPVHGRHERDARRCEAATTASLRLLFPAPVADADAAVDALALLVVGASAADPARCPHAPGLPGSRGTRPR